MGAHFVAAFLCRFAGIEIKQLLVGRAQLFRMFGNFRDQIFQSLPRNFSPAQKRRKRLVSNGAQQKHPRVCRRARGRFIHQRDAATERRELFPAERQIATLQSVSAAEINPRQLIVRLISQRRFQRCHAGVDRAGIARESARIKGRDFLFVRCGGARQRQNQEKKNEKPTRHSAPSETRRQKTNFSVSPNVLRMAVQQSAFVVATKGKGTYEITDTVAEAVSASGIRNGIVTIFVRHTSCSLIIMENADPTARRDLEKFFERLVPEDTPWFEHTAEGGDDSTSHIRAVLTRTSEVVPIAAGRMQLGTWQGIFLFEHRRAPHWREIALSIAGD